MPFTCRHCHLQNFREWPALNGGSQCSPGAMQVIALLYYTVSYFPGGANGVKFVMKMALGAFLNCCRGMQRAVTG